MTNLDQIITEGRIIGKKLFDFSMHLSKKITAKSRHEDERDKNYSAVLKAFLISGGQLSGQIIDAVSRKHLLLALIGLRSLLESYINVKYIFDHPEHRSDKDWAYDLCKDCFDRTNALDMLKNQLGDKSLKCRAAAIERADIYNKNYASLCDYTHLVMRPPFLNVPGKTGKYSKDILSQALCHMTDIVTVVLKTNGFDENFPLREEVVRFRDKYESRE